MSIDGQHEFGGEFPNPAEHAEALLEVCGGDIHEVRIIVAACLKCAKDEKERRYWSRVALVLSQDASVSIAPPLDEKTNGRPESASRIRR